MSESKRKRVSPAETPKKKPAKKRKRRKVTPEKRLKQKGRWIKKWRKKQRAIRLAAERRVSRHVVALLSTGRPYLYAARMKRIPLKFDVAQREALVQYCRRHWYSMAGFIREASLEAAGVESIGVLSTRLQRQPNFADPRATLPIQVAFPDPQLEALRAHAESIGTTLPEFVRSAVMTRVRRPELGKVKLS